jgi:hypothetical protein
MSSVISCLVVSYVSFSLDSSPLLLSSGECSITCTRINYDANRLGSEKRPFAHALLVMRLLKNFSSAHFSQIRKRAVMLRAFLSLREYIGVPALLTS